MIANGVSENVVKTLTHSLLPEHRRYQSCASMHAAARHRDCNHLWPMDDTDFAWASRERREKGLNHWSYESNESRARSKRSLSTTLQRVDLSSEAVGLCGLPPDEPQEQEPHDDDDDDDGDAQKSHDDDIEKSLTMPSVNVKTIRCALSAGTVIEVLWAILHGQRDVHPALVIKVQKTVVRIRWLKKIGSAGVLIVDETLAEQSVYIRHVSDTLAEVEELRADEPRPAGVSPDVRCWRSIGSDANSANDAAIPAPEADVSTAAVRRAALAPATEAASAAEATAVEAAVHPEDELSEQPALIDLAEPVLFGKARCIRGTAAYPSSNPVEWLSDSHLANAHAVDELPNGNVRVTYNYPREEASVPNIFGQRPATRVFQQRDRVLIQQFCGGCHWHNLCLIGPECRAYYWEPMAKNTLNSRHPIRTAFNNVAPDGWQLECIALQAQADGHSCGDWAHYFRTRVLRYAADDSLIGTGTFADFLAQGLINLMTLRGSARQTAERSQRRIARQLRDALRTLLRGAAQKGLLPWGDSQLEDFTSDGTVAHPIDLESLDESIEGNEGFVAPQADELAASVTRAAVAAAKAAACAAEAATAAAAAHPGDKILTGIAETARARAEKAADEAAMSLQVLEELQGKMDTGIRVNPALARLWGVDRGGN